MNIFYVALGGAIGSAARYLTVMLTGRLLPQQIFPYGTFVVNMVGCFLIAFIGALATDRINLTAEARLLFFTGVLGGFTTFSAFGYETFYLVKSSHLLLAFLNVLANVSFGLGAVWLGYMLAKI